jgi:hypothetical protein
MAADSSLPSEVDATAGGRDLEPTPHARRGDHEAVDLLLHASAPHATLATGRLHSGLRYCRH